MRLLTGLARNDDGTVCYWWQVQVYGKVVDGEADTPREAYDAAYTTLAKLVEEGETGAQL